MRDVLSLGAGFARARPTTRFVPLREVEDQAALGLHRAREMLVKQRTMLINALRGHLAEFGVVAPRGREGAEALCAIVADPEERRIPELLRPALMIFTGQIETLEAQIANLADEITAPASKALRLGSGPHPVYTYVVDTPSGVFSYSDDSPHQGTVLEQLQAWTLKVVRTVCR